MFLRLFFKTFCILLFIAIQLDSKSHSIKFFLVNICLFDNIGYSTYSYSSCNSYSISSNIIIVSKSCKFDENCCGNCTYRYCCQTISAYLNQNDCSNNYFGYSFKIL